MNAQDAAQMKDYRGGDRHAGPLVNNDQLPANMVSATPERLVTALLALQTQARSARELIHRLRDGNVQANLEAVDEAHNLLRRSQEVIKVMPRECFVIVEAARLLSTPIPDVTVMDLVFTGLISLDIR
ncbi:hypothetical protein [Pseudomonas sp. AB12(2023)]|uniref:hypothetical protein n=1 Tax=Pseudomonas sp. AB12(2023) TaxID=3048597 RepID=UPI002B23A1CF|nr:hypothetical protein [Pseudomonas sp. AB12(2023)]MEB0221345.1 hypothetical protein [Pseudomonas sp. AB12(2023)]